MLIDCTGHGVPGAFVTMLVKAIERQIVSKIENDKNIDVSPAWILSYFNKTMKKLLQQEDKNSISNSGFDGGIIYYNRKNQILKFAGAETPLFYIQDEQLSIVKGNRHSIGYKKSKLDYVFKDHVFKVKEGMQFYLTTDGYIDQNGGKKGFPFGKKALSTLFKDNFNLSFQEQKTTLLEALQNYQLHNERNDDITLLGFQIDKDNLLDILLEYNGALTQGIVTHCVEIIRNKISNINAMSKVSTVFIELIQNMMNYSHSINIDSLSITPEGYIEIVKDHNNTYHIKTKNLVSSENKKKMKLAHLEIHKLDEAGIKKRYKELRKSGERAHNKGAGIGFYEVAKITKDINYSFEQINEDRYIYEFKGTI